jgi:ABC-type glutathione transport system ATPase component
LFKKLGGLIYELSSRGLSFIIATHDPRVVGEWADRVYIIDHVKRRVSEIDKYHAVKYLEENAGVRYE